MKYLILLLLISNASYAKEMSCSSLFGFVRPSEEKIHEVILNLHALKKFSYSHSYQEAKIANRMFNEKFDELSLYISKSEIQERLRAVTVQVVNSQKPVINKATRSSSDILLEFLSENNFLDINGLNKDQETPILVATRKQRLDIVKMLIELKVNLNVTSSQERNTVLHIAAQGSSKEILSALLKTEARKQVNSSNNKNETPLFLALKNAEFVKLLIKNKADPKQKDRNGNSPLHYAASYGDIAVLKILIKNGANPNAINLDLQFTPLHYAKDFKTAELLIAAGADPQALNSSGESALHTTVSKDDPQLIELLYRSGLNLDLKGHRMQKSPLHRAAKDGKPFSAQKLIELGADKEVKDDYNETPLITAIIHKRVEVAKILISAGANINAFESGKYPLDVAKKHKVDEIVSLLKSLGAKEKDK